MKKFYSGLPLLFVLVIVMTACATPPLDEMNKAQDAVIRAESDIDAVIYGQNSLIRANDALARMKSEADAKRYDAAKNYASEAINNAENAIAEGKTGAARAKEEAADFINSLRGPLGETSAALNNARKVNNIQIDFDTLSRDMDSANRIYGEAQQSFQSNYYTEAIGKGQTVRSLLSSINTRLSEAAQDTNRKQ